LPDLEKQNNMTAEVNYMSDLRTTCLHIASGNQIITDAPTDNHGKGEAFSPTDLVATSLAACMLTVMGIKAQQAEIDIDGTKAKVTKIMNSEPRRIGEIQVHLFFPKNGYTDKEKSILEHTAMTCPVFHSLHPDMIKTIKFEW